MHTVYVILRKGFQCKWISINKYWYMTNHLGNPDLEGMSSCSILLQCTLHMDDAIAIVHVICDEKCKCVSNMHMSSEMNTAWGQDCSWSTDHRKYQPVTLKAIFWKDAPNSIHVGIFGQICTWAQNNSKFITKYKNYLRLTTVHPR